MNWEEIVKAMLPEHLLLAGMVILLTLEILRAMSRRERAGTQAPAPKPVAQH